MIGVNLRIMQKFLISYRQSERLSIYKKYAEQLGRWPQTIVTGTAGELIKDDCDFVDSWVPNLAVRGVVLTYKKHLEDQAEFAKSTKKKKTKTKK